MHFKQNVLYKILNTPQTLGVKILKSLFCSPKLHLFNKTYSKNSNTVKYYCHLK